MREGSEIFRRAERQWAQMKRDWDDYIADYVRQAEEALGYANAVNEKGRARNWTIDALIRAGGNTLKAYSTWELWTFVRDNPRLTIREFEKQWLDGPGMEF